MNINTVNRFYHSGLNVTNTATRLPNLELINNLTCMVPSGSLAVYLGGAGVTVNNGFQLNPGAGVTLAVDNSNLIYVISESSGQLRFIGN